VRQPDHATYAALSSSRRSCTNTSGPWPFDT
jgi:hypothetical protein